MWGGGGAGRKGRLKAQGMAFLSFSLSSVPSQQGVWARSEKAGPAPPGPLAQGCYNWGRERTHSSLSSCRCLCSVPPGWSDRKIQHSMCFPTVPCFICVPRRGFTAFQGGHQLLSAHELPGWAVKLKGRDEAGSGFWGCPRRSWGD